MSNITYIHNCEVCGSEVTSEEEIIMNKRYHGEKSNRCLCKQHLKRSLCMSEDMWDRTVERIKSKRG